MEIEIYHLNKTMFLCDKNVKQSTGCKYFYIHSNTSFSEIENFVQWWLEENENVWMFFESNKIMMSFLMMYLPNKFKLVYAAGGLINDEKNRYLFIFKKDYWDLPKGKIDKGERIQDAGIRECEEETGVPNLSIQKNLGLTYHIFHENKNYVLKITQWYLMHTVGHHPLVPQREEGIEKAEWMNIQDIQKEVVNNTYLSVRELLVRAGLLSEKV